MSYSKSLDFMMDKLSPFGDIFNIHTHLNLMKNPMAPLPSQVFDEVLYENNNSPITKFNFTKVFDCYRHIKNFANLSTNSLILSCTKVPYPLRSTNILRTTLLYSNKCAESRSVPTIKQQDKMISEQYCVNMTLTTDSKLDHPKSSEIGVIFSNSARMNSKELPCPKKLNSELVNRKTRELLKRSKKRRRRQKKVTNSKNSLEHPQAQVCIEVSVSQVSSPGNQSTINACDSSLKNKDKREVQCTPISSIFIAVESASDDDSDWDTPTNLDNPSPSYVEIEFTGLCITDFTPHIYPIHHSVFSCDISSDQNDLEDRKLQNALRKVNLEWNKANKEIDSSPKIPSKVTFAADDMTEVFPVEEYNRKGEWETYAIERIRFKRRIDEVEKILSPCLTADHRSKVYERIFIAERQ